MNHVNESHGNDLPIPDDMGPSEQITDFRDLIKIFEESRDLEHVSNVEHARELDDMPDKDSLDSDSKSSDLVDLLRERNGIDQYLNNVDGGVQAELCYEFKDTSGYCQFECSSYLKEKYNLLAEGILILDPESQSQFFLDSSSELLSKKQHLVFNLPKIDIDFLDNDENVIFRFKIESNVKTRHIAGFIITSESILNDLKYDV